MHQITGILFFILIFTGLLKAEAGPNVILINTDNLGCHGSKVHRTPVTDQLVKDGVRFTDFFAASPACTSSRAALLTGCYPWRNGMHGFEWDGRLESMTRRYTENRATIKYLLRKVSDQIRQFLVIQHSLKPFRHQ